MTKAKWKPGRWFRIYSPDGKLWSETSDRQEAMEESEEKGWPVYQLWQRTKYEWREVKPK